MVKNKLHDDDLNKCFYKQHFSKNQIYKFTNDIINLKKKV